MNRVEIIKDMGRRKMFSYFGELGCRVGCEIGTFWGRGAQIMVETIPDIKLYLVDPLIPYGGWLGTKHSINRARYFLNKRLKNLRRENHNITYIEKSSRDAVQDFEDESLDFVYIDGNHSYPEVSFDIEAWSKKVKRGGIISGDDFDGRWKQRKVIPDVTKAVFEFMESKGIETIYLSDSSVRIDKGDYANSWYFIKNYLS